MATFDLKLKTGDVVQWDGKSGEDAAKRYTDSHPGSVVVAWKYSPAIKIGWGKGMIIIEP